MRNRFRLRRFFTCPCCGKRFLRRLRCRRCGRCFSCCNCRKGFRE
ncbi:hypothetical protein [Terrisporobacter petrolearius]|nr:hypothetical protein [Terrisporobacter petrolearius]